MSLTDKNWTKLGIVVVNEGGEGTGGVWTSKHRLLWWGNIVLNWGPGLRWSRCGGHLLFWLCMWFMGIFVFNCMMGMSLDQASQWSVDMGKVVAKEASPVEDSNGWHFMEGFVWTRGKSHRLDTQESSIPRRSVSPH